MSPTMPMTPGDEPPGPQYFGRWDHADPAAPFAGWGAVGVRARFEGTSVTAKLRDTVNTFTVSIDGGPFQTIAPGAATEVQLAKGLGEGPHNVDLFRRSEGFYGKTTFSGFVLDPGKQLLAPPARPQRKLEFLGDSISAGYGDEGGGGNSPQNENGFMAYGPQVARKLGAEWSVIAHSGHGVYRNLCEALPPSQPHMLDEFKLVQPPEVGQTAWDFSRYQPDALVIALGTNDFSDWPPGTCAPPDEVAFRAAYVELLRFARSVYPSAHLFALGTFNATAGNQFGTCNKSICAAVDTLADQRIHCIDPSLGPEGSWLVGPDDYIGDWTHPTVAGHTKLAERLAHAISSVLGW